MLLLRKGSSLTNSLHSQHRSSLRSSHPLTSRKQLTSRRRASRCLQRQTSSLPDPSVNTLTRLPSNSQPDRNAISPNNSPKVSLDSGRKRSAILNPPLRQPIVVSLLIPILLALLQPRHTTRRLFTRTANPLPRIAKGNPRLLPHPGTIFGYSSASTPMPRPETISATRSALMLPARPVLNSIESPKSYK